LQRQFDASQASAAVCNEPSFIMTADMSDAIDDVRAQYEDFNAKSLNDLEEFYNEKVSNGLLKIVCITEH